MSTPSSKNWIGYLAIVAGGVTLALGAVVLLGWYTHDLDLIQVNPAFVPMQYNTALGFVLGGGGLLALAFAWSHTAAVLGGITLLIGALTLIEYIFGANLHIDQLFMEHYIDLKTSNPGRMAPNTALCFSLTCIAMLAASLWKSHARSPGTVGILGAMTAGLGFVAFTGYLVGVETAYGWGNLTRMAIHTSAGFVVLGSGLIALAWSRNPDAGLPRWFFPMMSIGVMTITLSIWQALTAYENQLAASLGSQAKNYIDESVLVFGTIFALILILMRWQKTVRQKIVTYIVLPTFLVIALVLGYANLQADRYAASQIRSSSIDLSRYHASRIEIQLREIAQIASTTADVLTISDRSLTRKRFYDLLEKNVSSNPFVYGAAIAFEPGEFSGIERFAPYGYRKDGGLASIDIAASYDYTEPQWEWYTAPRNSGHSLWTEPYFDEGAGNIKMVTFSVPFRRDGQVIGITTIDVDLSKLNKFAQSDELDKNDFIILSKKGNLVFHDNPDYVGKPLSIAQDELTEARADEMSAMFSTGESGCAQPKPALSCLAQHAG